MIVQLIPPTISMETQPLGPALFAALNAPDVSAPLHLIVLYV